MIALAALLLVVVVIAVWAGRGSETRPQAPDNALSNPGGGNVDYGPLTDAEMEAHEATLRELDR